MIPSLCRALISDRDMGGRTKIKGGLNVQSVIQVKNLYKLYYLGEETVA